MKTPWTLIGWLLAGLVALLLSLGLYYLGLALEWRPWLAPAILWLPLLAAALFRLLAWALGRPKAPALAALDPSNPFTGPWEAIKSGLGEGAWELYLVAGDDDEGRRSFINRALGQAEYQAAPAGPEGLSLWAAEGRAWLNVPAALWSEEAEGQGPPGGDWAHLLKLLPGFPGPLSGLLVLADPRKIAENPELEGRILAKKLQSLAARPRSAPPWWLVLYPLENLASGQRLAEALEGGATDGEMWRRPFGLFLDGGDPRAGLPQRLARAQAFLADRLAHHLGQIDYWPGRPLLAGEILAFQDEFRRLPLDYFSAEADGGPGAGPCEGLFLALAAPRSPGQFNELLLRNLIPNRRAEGEAAQRRGPRRLIWGGVGLVFLAGLAALAIGYWQGRRALDLAVEARPILARLESRPTAPPPVAALAAGADLALDLDRLAASLAGLYNAPREAAAQTRGRLARQLRRHLPRDYARSAPLMKALTEWVDQETAPLSFTSAEETVTVPGFAAGAGRARVAGLAARWGAILGRDGRGDMERLLNRYDQIVFEEWRRKAEESLRALEPTPERLRRSGLAGLGARPMGLDFLKAAGYELSFQTGGEFPGWIRAARELAVLDSLGDLVELDGGGRELASVLKRLDGGGLNLDANGLERLVGAARTGKEYEAALYGLSGLVESPRGLALLAGETFSGAPAPPERVGLPALRQRGQAALAALEKLSPIASLEERRLFEGLILSQSEWIEGVSVAAAALALEEEWNRKVVLPAKDLSEGEKAALLLGGEGAVAAFRDGPAGPYLDAGPGGYRPREALGRKFPWSREFLRFLNANQEVWKKAAEGDWQLDLSARLRPVRAEGDWLSSHPLGVNLEVLCGEEEFWTETYNQPTVFQARWSPQTCGPLDVTVIFRDFALTKSYEGTDGLIAFVQEAMWGEIRLGPDDFPGQRHLLDAVGAEAVTVSLDLDRGRELLETLTAPAVALKPPANIIAWE